ncbi:bifunctional HisA/TrpF protein [Propionibacterium sp. oral taxon 192 str. F0372]|nr:bifunctional HisA/TrpF protein [Propionibacterium sp. oral taxon 192 str. F0372]
MGVSMNTAIADRLVLLPAVDVQDGKAVQLVQGVVGSQREFGDPLEAALRWQEQGAQWLHLVDLDAAFGRGSNAGILAEVIDRVDMDVELSGGIRDAVSLERALATGATRVNIGTAALESPEWCEEILAEYGERVAIGLDVRDGQLAARGWTISGGDVFGTVERMTAAGCTRFVVTDVASDGMLTGPNLELLGAVCARTDAKVVASGGISSLEDLRLLVGLVPIGVEGAIIGTALYLGNFTLAEALEISRGPGTDT